MEFEKLDLEELNSEKLTEISGGSPFSDGVMYCFGAFCAGWYHAATDPAIRPSEYR